ncbi:MAG TPA: DUF3297 family protein, partial [Phenylobacterium sp.]|nr:DUF3297 family protein [Phenylobacterium sp.]
AAAGVERVERERFFAESDVVTVHLKLSPRSVGYVGRAELALMKPSALLVNTSRGPVVDEAALARGVGVRFKGVEKNNVDEYCVSEGWVRLAVGKTLDRKGNPVTVKLQGEVEPYFRGDDQA